MSQKKTLLSKMISFPLRSVFCDNLYYTYLNLNTSQHLILSSPLSYNYPTYLIRNKNLLIQSFPSIYFSLSQRECNTTQNIFYLVFIALTSSFGNFSNFYEKFYFLNKSRQHTAIENILGTRKKQIY